MKTFPAGSTYGPESAGNLKYNRLAKSGRIELLEVVEITDHLEIDFFLVRITGFSEERDGASLRSIGSRPANGYWRFVAMEQALAKFQQLAVLPQYAKELANAQKSSIEKAERMRAMSREGVLS